MLIRAARKDEAHILSELAFRSKAYWGYDDAFMAACRDELRISESAIECAWIAVAEREGRVLGFVALEGSPPQGALDMLFVEPDALRQCIGGRLFEHAKATAQAFGFVRLTIDSDPNAEPFYLAMGATRIGVNASAAIPGRILPLLAVTLTESTPEQTCEGALNIGDPRP